MSLRIFIFPFTRPPEPSSFTAEESEQAHRRHAASAVLGLATHRSAVLSVLLRLCSPSYSASAQTSADCMVRSEATIVLFDCDAAAFYAHFTL